MREVQLMKTSFQNLSSNKLYVPFITAGDPHPDVTIELALALQEAGATAIELGIAYSDPLADGPVIQAASKRALQNGMNIIKSMELVPLMRQKGLKIPIILFTYYNPVLQLGGDSFFALMRKNTIDGLLIPDLPFEESEGIRIKCKENGVAYISLVAPTSSKRIRKIAEQAEGFIYCVSSLGVTGVRKQFDKSIASFINEVNTYSNVPVVVGFGISTREQVEEMTNICDGVVVGSALIREIERLQKPLLEESTREDALREFKDYAKSLFSYT